MLQVLQPLLPDDAALLDPAGLPGAGPLLPGQDGHRSREAPHPRRHGSLVAHRHHPVGHRQAAPRRRQQLGPVRLEGEQAMAIQVGLSGKR